MTNVIPLLSVKGYETLWNLSNSNHKIFWENPSHDELRQSLEEAIAAKGEPPETLYDGEITLETDLSPLNNADLQDDTTDAKNAPVVRAALPEITSARAADHRLWAVRQLLCAVAIRCQALEPKQQYQSATTHHRREEAPGMGTGTFPGARHRDEKRQCGSPIVVAD